MRWIRPILILILAQVPWMPGAAADPPFRDLLSKIAPKTPRQSLASFHVRDGFQVELVCAEPLVADPIAVDWGADGRLWVVEMGDYPNAQHGSKGRIRYLVDSDGDGAYDRSRIFIDDLSFPTGVMAWRRGVLITCAPEILYAADTTGDGKADQREVLFRGFIEGNPQHRVNGLRWGLDNWIYGANGDSGGNVVSLKTGAQVDIHARDFRIRPETGEIETQTGMAQYGRCRDDWGNWFGGRNLQPIWHCALEDHYLRRNRYLVPPDPCVDLLEPPTCAPVYPVSETLPRFNEFWTLNRFTSACGIAFYRDDLFGSDYSHSFFICEPPHNLVYHGQLHPKGATFFGRRSQAFPNSEFLASHDHWFRPVQVRTGPDGALWVVDMYRLVIEHPDYIPAKWHDQLDFRAGRGRGRIYRVFPKGTRPRDIRPLDRCPTGELVRLLDDPNGPRRDLIQQFILSRGLKDAQEPLEELVRTCRRPQSRLTALCTLDGLGAMRGSTLLHALGDLHAAVRRHAIRISEPFLNDDPRLQQAVLRLVDDSDAQVRMQLAYSLGEFDDRRAGVALAQIAVRDANDPLIIAAVMSSATGHPGAMLQRLVEGGVPSRSQVALIENLLRLVLEAREYGVLTTGLEYIAAPRKGRYRRWQYQVLAGFLDSLEYQADSLASLHQLGLDDLRAAIELTDFMFDAARSDALNSELDLSSRVQAVRLVGRGLNPQEDDPQRLSELLVPQNPVELQKSAVAGLGLLRPDDLPQILLGAWHQHGPEIRPPILALMLAEETWALELLERMATEDISTTEIGATVRNRLILHISAKVRRRASELFRSPVAAERQEAIERFRSLFARPSNANRGREVFRKHCATCHQLEGVGTNIGPDLLALTDRSSEAMLVAILDPNRAVEPRWVEYSAITRKGRIFSGIVAAESGNSITLIDAQGATHSLLRTDLQDLESIGKSMMPVGVEQLLSEPQELLDLIAYLRSIDSDAKADRLGK